MWTNRDRHSLSPASAFANGDDELDFDELEFEEDIDELEDPLDDDLIDDDPAGYIGLIDLSPDIEPDDEGYDLSELDDDDIDDLYGDDYGYYDDEDDDEDDAYYYQDGF